MQSSGCAVRHAPAILVDDLVERAAADRADHRFGGIGPCDGWVALHEALTTGLIGDGELILIQVRVPQREGWVLMRAEATADLVLARGEVPDGAPGVSR